MDDRRQGMWRQLWAGLVLAVCVAVIWVVPSLAGPDDAGRELLPDLDQAVPSHVNTFQTTTSSGAKEFGLGFDSAVDNVGEGPLLIHGSRASLDEPSMQATQRVGTATGGTVDYPGSGRLSYVSSPDHSHWHLLGFDRYELRRPGTHDVVRPDRKTGFCLGDRYETDRATDLPGEPPRAVMTGYCEPSNQNAMAVDEGMSVGWGDNYLARLEGQSVDVTGLEAGRYLLIHRVNADGRLREASIANNAASVVLELSWPLGTDAKPSVTVLARCPDSDACQAPQGAADTQSGGGTAPVAPASTAVPRLPTMTAAVAGYFVRQSLVRRFGRRIRGLRRSCARRTAISFSCRVRFTRSPYHYTGRVWVGHSLAGGRVTYRRRIDVTGTRAPCRGRRSACRRRVLMRP